jgi:hypothetical protein
VGLVCNPGSPPHRDRLTIHSAAATRAALVAIATAGGAVLLLVLPAMYLQFAVFARPELEVTE